MNHIPEEDANQQGSNKSAKFREILEELQSSGILLESDARLPSVAGIVAGAPVAGSWWGHPRAHAMYAITQHLVDHPEVVVTKLVSGKVTFVHRKLWPALFAIASAREPWQIENLSSPARFLLDAVDKEGEVRTDQIHRRKTTKENSPGEAARELEKRLLVHSENIHTASGAHAKRLETWERWASRASPSLEKMTREEAKKDLEMVLADLNTRFRAAGHLPWLGTRSVKAFGRSRLSKVRSS